MYARTCKGCGNEFETNHYRQQRCQPECGRSESKHSKRALARLTNDITFVGVDGEGVDRPDGKHEYVMLSVGGRTLWEDGNALSLKSILAFLYDQYTSEPEAAYVGFFLGYDFIQWQKLLPEDVARSLLTEKGIAERKSRSKLRANPYPDAVVWEGWEIDIMAGRRFKLRPHVHHVSEYNGLCRNRTCRKVMRDVPPDSFDSSEPSVFVHGESHWVLDESAPTDPYHGDIDTFWDFFTSYRSHSVGQGAHKSKAYGWMYICDTGPFWQTSFLNVINPKAWDGNPVCSDDEYSLIVKGKADRGTIADYGDVSYYSEMRMYNVLENEILARVTQRLNQGFMNDRIPIKIPKTDWYGPGRAAQLWMDHLHALAANPSAVEANRVRLRNPELAQSTERTNETGLLNADVYLSMPTWFYDASRDSYYGGWFEQFMHGHVGNVWEYDINSAYPFIIASLPCLHTGSGHNGSYTQGNGTPPREDGRYTLVYGTVRGSNRFIGAMPYRTKQGNISRPQITKGWYWEHELNAARRANLIDTIEIEKWVSYLACDCTPPFDPPSIGISKLYQARLDFGKNTPQGKSAKLVYNSAYGKTAQSIGTPKYANPVYASLITAGCRTLILDAIGTHPRGASAVSMVATDGIYFTSPHLSLDLDKARLGAWDETYKEGMTQLMPGVYWDNATRERIGLGQSPKLKSRGVNARDLARQIHRLDGLFSEAHLSLANGGEYAWPEIEFSVDFLLDSAKLALQRGKWDTAGKVTHGSVRRISSNPITKRMPLAYRSDETDGGITRTYPYREYEEIVSTPYQQSFGFVEANPMDGTFGGRIGRDGTDGMQYWRDLLNGD